MGAKICPPEGYERVAWIVSEIVGIIEATKALRLDWATLSTYRDSSISGKNRKVYRTSRPGPKWTNGEWE